MKVIDPDDEVLIIPINKKTHRVRIESETESAMTVIVEPLGEKHETTSIAFTDFRSIAERLANPVQDPRNSDE